MKFIVFEGLDGSGKTTLIQKLSNHLDQCHISHICTREPGGTELADEIRHLVLRTNAETPCARAELLLYEAARAQHVEHKIKPTLLKKQWVLCDRFSASSIAFQSAGRKISEHQVHWLNEFATDQLHPDLNILLDLTVEESERRRAQRGEEIDRIEKETQDFHQRIRTSFREQAQKNPSQWLQLDACLSPDILFSQTLEHLKALQWLK